MLLLFFFQLVFLFSQCSAEGIEVFGTITSLSTATATSATSLSPSYRRRRFLIIGLFCVAAVLSQVTAIALHLFFRARKLDIEDAPIKTGKNLDERECAKD
ncbi:uncharacterized protein EV420DRAFT_1538123 [Desarmillaria tabescens]|uniref:Uncharacterized protein n=1 Tax=Armillaria tabescens TaxID=1929756 RepID=A0AA39KFL3_ARMTA|nr:uncharacterized protein EV420DRAFT_1538123 [Desarmillaria tabescens]KAK0459060.1 hypothetical protein EV420DRAFT_1538123 [Desarmillaria tabescens]